MKNLIKLCLPIFLLCIGYIQYVSAEVKMNNQQVERIKKLKTQGIEPNKVYFQDEFALFIANGHSYPEEDLFSSQEDLEDNQRMYTTAVQNISQIKLNDNYQYSEIWQRKRNIIEILYPTDAFQSLEDGVYFYTLDEHKQLHQHASFKEVFELPCYLRVEKKQGIVVSIQKRPLSTINHYIYHYWPSNNLIKQIEISLYDYDYNAIFSSVVYFDEVTGEMIKTTSKNIKTGRSSIETNIEKNGIYSIEEYFDKQGVKTNRVTRYENSFVRVKNEVLNEQGNIIKTKSWEPEEILDLEKDLDEPYPYNELMMNVEKSNTLFKAEMFKQGLGDSPKYDKEAINRVKYLGIKPHQVYYHKLPFPAFMVERYKNFPHQAPLTLTEAENQSPRDKYSDLIQVEIGDNHQYKKIIKTKWQQSAISLPLAQFKGLENGVYFYTMDDKKQLTPLANVEQAVSLPAYIRVEKVMGKVVSILQKTRVQWLTNEFDYKKSAPIRSKLTVIESHLVPNLVIETEFEKGSYLPLKQVIKNAQGITIRTFIMTKKRDLIAILERFNDQGIKTNHIELFEDGQGGYLKNQHLDSNVNILLTTDEFEDKNNPQLYDNLLFNPDGFETILFEHFD